MTRNETAKILAVLKAAYPHAFKDITKVDAEAMLNLWTRQLERESMTEVSVAVDALIATRTDGYSPTIGEIKEQLRKLKSVHELDELSAWALVSKACSNGLYGYKKEFEKLPPDVQRAVGSPEQLREWASVDVDTFQSVIASNFQRNYRTNQMRQRELQKLLDNVRQMIGEISKNLLLEA